MKRTFIVLAASFAVSCASSADKNKPLVAGAIQEAPAVSACSPLTDLITDMGQNDLKNSLGQKTDSLGDMVEYKAKNPLPDFYKTTITRMKESDFYLACTTPTKDKETQMKAFETIKAKYADCLKDFKLTDKTASNVDKMPELSYESDKMPVKVSIAVGNMGGEYAVALTLTKTKSGK